MSSLRFRSAMDNKTFISFLFFGLYTYFQETFLAIRGISSCSGSVMYFVTGYVWAMCHKEPFGFMCGWDAEFFGL